MSIHKEFNNVIINTTSNSTNEGEENWLTVTASPEGNPNEYIILEILESKVGDDATYTPSWVYHVDNEIHYEWTTNHFNETTKIRYNL